jgi:hypothetical protein
MIVKFFSREWNLKIKTSDFVIFLRSFLSWAMITSDSDVVISKKKENDEEDGFK